MKKLLCLACGWLLNGPVWAAVSAPPQTPTAAIDAHEINMKLQEMERKFNFGLTWDGNVEIQASDYQNKAYNDLSAREATVRAHFKPGAKIGDGYELRTDLLFRGDAENSTRNTVRIDETYVSAKLSPDLTFRAGKMIYSWGSAPFYNPTDSLNPVDYYDILHPDKLGIIAIDGSWRLAQGLSLTGGVIPVFETSIIVDSTSRWIDYSRILKEAILSRASLPSNISADRDVTFTLERITPKKPQAFVRLEANTIDFDFAFLYSYRYSATPSDLSVNSNTTFDFINNTPRIEIEGVPFYRQEHFFGLDVSAPLLGCVFFFEGAASVPISHDASATAQEQLQNLNRLGLGSNLSVAQIEQKSKVSPYSILTFGFRKDWSKFHFAIQFGTLLYFGDSRPGELFQAIIKAAAPNIAQEINPSFFYDYVTSVITPGASWDVSDKVTLKLGGLYNGKLSGFYLAPAVEYKFKDGLKATLGYEYLDGRQGTVYHYYTRNSRVSLNMMATF